MCIDAEDEHHDEDADEDVTVSSDVVTAPSSTPAPAAKAAAFQESDTSSEVSLVFSDMFLGRLPKVDLIILEGEKCPSVRMSVRPSVHKKFLRFE